MSLIPARSILEGDGSGLTGREFVRSDKGASRTCIISKLRGVRHGRVFVVTVGLAGDDLPITVAPEPGVGDVIMRLQILTEDGFGFVRVVTQNGRVANDPADDVLDLDGAGISRRQRGDVGDEFGFIERPPLFVGESAIVGEIFFPGRLVSGDDRVVKFLGAMDELGFRDRCVGGNHGSRKDEITK